jgi:HTH-type transcriptional regulator / antitoxin HigA
METNTLDYRPDYVVAPGEILEETLEARGLTKADFAERCGRSAKFISEVISGKAPVTPETAIQFERVLGVSAAIWSNLEADYRLRQAAAKERERLAAASAWAERFPLKAMRNFELISKTATGQSLVEQLLGFLGIASPDQWEPVLASHQAAFRSAASFARSPEAVAVWLRWGERLAAEIDSAPYSTAAFRIVLETIRGLTREPITVARPEIERQCAAAGVAVLFTPELPGTHLCGAARWLTPEKAVIQLSLRYKTDDQLYFTFFHEAGHILLHGKKVGFLYETDARPDNQEEQANHFAADFLLPPPAWRRFTEGRRRFTKSAVAEFAAEQGIAPGIVVGRLQREGHLPYAHLNGLKVRWLGTGHRAASATISQSAY